MIQHHLVNPLLRTRMLTRIVVAAVVVLANIACCPAYAQFPPNPPPPTPPPSPWSRSFVTGTVKGFPVNAHHLILAQDNSQILFAFDSYSGAPAWNLTLHEVLFPSVVPTTTGTTSMAVIQGNETTFAVNIANGEIVWTYRSQSTPVFIPLLTDDGTQLLTTHFVNETAYRCVVGLDVATGNQEFEHCEHQLFALTLEDGDDIPIVITEKTFFGCFESPLDKQLSIVLEIQLNDPAFPPHVFDFHPMTVMMTRTVGFVTHTDDDWQAGGERHNNNTNKNRNHNNNNRKGHDGRAIRCTWAVSAWDSVHQAYTGATHVVSVVAQVGLVTWHVTLGSAQQLPLTYLNRRKPQPHEIIATDGVSFLVALDSGNGHMKWNATINGTYNLSSPFSPEKKMAQTNPTSGAGGGVTAGAEQQIVELGPIAHLLQTDHHVIYSQPLLSSSSSGGVSVTPTDRIAIVDLFSGTLVRQVDVFDTVCANLMSHGNILYIPNQHELAVFNFTSMSMQTMFMTNSPVYRLRDVEDDERLLFGTAYTIYCVPLL